MLLCYGVSQIKSQYYPISPRTVDVQDTILRVMIRGSFMLLARKLSTFYARIYKSQTPQISENVHYTWTLDGVIQEQVRYVYYCFVGNTCPICVTIFMDFFDNL